MKRIILHIKVEGGDDSKCDVGCPFISGAYCRLFGQQLEFEEAVAMRCGACVANITN
jgi:hypothetical protein